MNPLVLQKFLWGDYYYSEKKVYRKPCYEQHRPMFVQFVLEPLIAEYRKHFAPIDSSSAVEVKEARTKVKAQLTKWMPMEKGILGMVVQHIPSPATAQETKIAVVCPGLKADRAPRQDEDSEENQVEWEALKAAVIHCSHDSSAPVVAYATKMQPVSSRLYDIVTRAQVKSESSVRMVAFSRVFSGQLKRG